VRLGNLNGAGYDKAVQILGTGVNATYVVPEMIVVAIPNTNRTRDLTPTKSMTTPDGKTVPGFAVSGGGAKFLQSILSRAYSGVTAPTVRPWPPTARLTPAGWPPKSKWPSSGRS
jgi:hypothetical protein